eukprot:TRINITY_DN3885_c0_g1_i1.p1 TRINITY_DN3885_c0_g1~~TRINITY_DN3885_c0_g1_i1.p1  ORF type:complete len:510 (+),score=81.07 TRINITY_DN3885_c0_g1_i1:1389-2918(+)
MFFFVNISYYQHPLKPYLIESSVFLLKGYLYKIEDEMIDIGEVYDLIPRFPDNTILQKSVLGFIGASGKWISDNEKYFSLSFNYVMDALSHKLHVTVAATAFYELCIWCRRFMLDNALQIIEHLGPLMNEMNPAPLELIVKGISQILYELPYELSFQILQQITSVPIMNLNNIMQSGDTGELILKDVNTNLRLFSSACMHVADPTKKTEQDMERHPLKDLLIGNSTWECLYNTCLKFSFNDEVIETITRIFNYVMSNLGVYHFVDLVDIFVKVMRDTFNANPHSSILKVTVYALDIIRTQGNQVVLPDNIIERNVNTMTTLITAYTEKIFNMFQPDNYSSVSLYKEYYLTLTQVLNSMPEVFFAMGKDETNVLFQVTVRALMHLNERQVFKTAIAFIEAFMGKTNEFFQSIAQKNTTDLVKILLFQCSENTYSQQLMSNVTARIFQLYRTLYNDDFKQLLSNLLNEFQVTTLTPQYKEFYLNTLYNTVEFKQIEALQAEFITKCRGMEH